MSKRSTLVARRLAKAIKNDVFTASGQISSAGISATQYDSIGDLPLSGVTAGTKAFINDSDRLYISNGTGWYSIALTNASPSITSVLDSDGGTTPFTLATDGSATVITVSATDSDGFPITYNYSVTSGSLTNGGGTTATVTQGTGADTNKFTVTPSTTEAYAGTFELTFTISDGVGQTNSTNSFSLSFETAVENSRYTTLLLDVVDTSDNNTIVDSSSNNETITVYGNPSAGSFSPYRHGSYTNYFDGTNSYIRFNNDELQITTEDFTIEAWVNMGYSAGSKDIASHFEWYMGNNQGWWLFISSTGLIYLNASHGVWNSSTTAYVSTNSVPLNQWAHVAICRESGTISSYINGVKDSYTASYANSLNQSGYNSSYGRAANAISYVGTHIADNIIRNPFLGNMADFHFKLGSAKYNSNFDVPTERLTAETGTTILLFNGGREVKDNSVNNYSFTNASVGFKTPGLFDNLEYSATDHGTSIYFDGSGDTLELQSSVASVVSVDFTAECWIYPRVLGGAIMDKDHKPNVSFPLWALTISSTGVLNNFIGSGNGTSSSQLISTAAGVIKLNTWHHIVVTKSGSTLTTYVDGVQESSATITANLIDGGKPFYIGSRSKTDSWFNGYIADLRFVKGSVLYTSNFTPPTAPYTTSTGLDLHLKGTEASIIDKSQTNNLQLVGNTTGSTTQVKFANTKSVYFDGNGDYVSIASNPAFGFGTGDFTIEFWTYWGGTLNSLNGGSIVELRSAVAAEALVVYLSTSGEIRFYDGPSNVEVGSGVTITQAWTHIALTRESGLWRIFVNGTLGATRNSSTDLGSSKPCQIGQGVNGTTTAYHGYIQDLRITKGLARYTSNFTPNTTPLRG